MRISYLLIFVFVVFVSCKDSDGDGVYDKYDNCPEIEGLKEHEGCPDTDADGVIDSEDECPDEFGLDEFKGCPDTDEDGVPDNEDDCPETPGLEKFNGCPNNDKMKLLASNCFESLNLTNKEILEYTANFETQTNSIITYKFCNLIYEYIMKDREIQRDYNAKMGILQKQINGGYIQTVWRTEINNLLIQKLIVLKNNLYYLMEIGNGGECSMGTMIFDENNNNWQEVLVRKTPYKVEYKVHQMRITDVSSNFDQLNLKMKGY